MPFRTFRKVGRSHGRRKLEMRCRVEGCKNRSKGPRFGFICDEHLKKLSMKEQQAARVRRGMRSTLRDGGSIPPLGTSIRAFGDLLTSLGSPSRSAESPAPDRYRRLTAVFSWP